MVFLSSLFLISVVGFAKSEKIDICHLDGKGDSKTISISDNALGAHFQHGDTIGPCPPSCLPGFQLSEDGTDCEQICEDDCDDSNLRTLDTCIDGQCENSCDYPLAVLDPDCNIHECIDGFQLSDDGEECIKVEILAYEYAPENIDFYFETCDGVMWAESDSWFLAKISGYAGSVTFWLDDPNRDDHVVGELDSYRVRTNQAVSLLTDTLTLTAHGSDGWCIRTIQMVKGQPGEEIVYGLPSTFWLDKPCTSTHYFGIPCYEERIFNI